MRPITRFPARSKLPPLKISEFLTATIALGLSLITHTASAAEGAKKPNILVIWGDDIGQFNVSA